MQCKVEAQQTQFANVATRATAKYWRYTSYAVHGHRRAGSRSISCIELGMGSYGAPHEVRQAKAWLMGLRGSFEARRTASGNKGGEESIRPNSPTTFEPAEKSNFSVEIYRSSPQPIHSQVCSFLHLAVQASSPWLTVPTVRPPSTLHQRLLSLS